MDAQTRNRLRARLLSKLLPEPNSGCWLWEGSSFSNGYGYVHISGRGKTRKIGTAHRISYLIFKGEIPEGLEVMHKCDVRCCFNPQHLSVGTKKDNMQDCLRKGRFRGGPPLGNRNAAKKKLTA